MSVTDEKEPWKPTPESQRIIDEITAICNSLGKLDENDGTYMKDRDCKACLREMLRYLASNSDGQVARLTLGSLNVIKSDLIPLIVQYCDFNEGDSDLFGLILRLCTNLTSSANLFFENQDIPTEIADKQLYDQLCDRLQRFKEAFANDELVWCTLNTHLRHNTEDEIAFERLIILIRNILQIPSNTEGQAVGLNPGYDSHDTCLNHMEKSGMLSSIIHVASNTQLGTEFCFHINEIIYYMLRDQNPKTLAMARSSAFKRSLDDLDEDKKRLAELSARDKRMRKANNRDLALSYKFKHTSFTVRNCRGLGDAPLITRRPLDSRESIKFDQGKVDLRKARNKKPLESRTPILNSDSNVRASKFAYSLKIFCKQFVEKVYANYMQQIKHNLIQKKAQEEDEAYYLWAIQFFTAFSRHLHLPIDHISENLSTSSLHFIQILITNYLDKIKIEKKKFHGASNKLHLSLRAYREILLLIKSIDRDSEYFETAEKIQKKLFSEVEYSSLLLTMFQQYDEPKHSAHYLKDLIQTNSIFLELLQEYSSTHAPVENPDGAPKEKPTKKRKKKMDLRAANSLMRYCCPYVIAAHLKVLESFKTNDENTNVAILSLFEGIAYDCKNEIMLFQASILRCLLEIMSYDPSMPGYDGFKALGEHLMKEFGAMANKRRWMFQELLFCKTFTDVTEIQDAINPPPVMPEADERLVYSPQNTDSAEAQEIIPQETSQTTPPSLQPTHNDSLADLLAELGDSDDDDDDDDGKSVSGGSIHSNNSQPPSEVADVPTESDPELHGDIPPEAPPEEPSEEPPEQTSVVPLEENSIENSD